MSKSINEEFQSVPISNFDNLSDSILAKFVTGCRVKICLLGCFLGDRWALMAVLLFTSLLNILGEVLFF